MWAGKGSGWEDRRNGHRRQRRQEAEGFPHHDEAAQAGEERPWGLSHWLCLICCFPVTDNEVTTGGSQEITGRRWPNRTRKGAAGTLEEAA